MKKIIFKILKGIGIGSACLIPGVSAGTFAIITKCFDDLVSNITLLLKKFFKAFLNLLPYGIGVIIGLIITYFVVRVAFSYLLFSILCVFAGLILGSFPDIFKEIKDTKPTLGNTLVFVVCFFIVIALSISSFLLETYSGYSLSALFANKPWYLYVIVFFVGLIGSSGIITPGISGAMILLVVGLYQPMINTLHELAHLEGDVAGNVCIVLVFVAGVIIGLFLISFLLKRLLTYHKEITYYGICGLVLASVIAIFLNHNAWYGDGAKYLGIIKNPIEAIIGIFIFIGCAIGMYFLLKKLKKEKN